MSVLGGESRRGPVAGRCRLLDPERTSEHLLKPLVVFRVPSPAPRPSSSRDVSARTLRCGSHVKRFLKLGRLRLRGPRGTQDEFVLGPIAQNRRFAALLARPPLAEVLCIA